MPAFESITELLSPVAIVFDFLTRPANLEQVTPPEFHARYVAGPDRLFLGAVITVRMNRFGLPQTIVSEVTAFEPDVAFTDEQRRGPFQHFVHTHRLESLPAGRCRMTDRLEYEPPSGLLGLALRAVNLDEILQRSFAYRAMRFRELFGPKT
jgi:ligand-binding SRPBCC domain-containing protein